MHMFTGNDADFGLTEDWLLLDVASATTADDDDDARFERWLASVSPNELDALNDLVDDAAHHVVDRKS